jgi:CpeT protein
VSEVLVDHENWISRDQGFDPITNTLQWGSEHGPLQFQRIASFENEVTAEWRSLTNDQREEAKHIG